MEEIDILKGLLNEIYETINIKHEAYTDTDKVTRISMILGGTILLVPNRGHGNKGKMISVKSLFLKKED